MKRITNRLPHPVLFAMLICWVVCVLGVQIQDANAHDINRFDAIEPDPNHYLDRCAMFTSGRLTRFQRSQISVFVEPVPASFDLNDVYQPTVVECLKRWEVVNDLDFTFVSMEESADIRIFWSHHPQLRGLDPHASQAVLIQPKKEKPTASEIQVEIEIFLRFLPPDRLKTVLLHEIGHAIGIWGHSTNAMDVMYFEPIVSDLSKRDVATANQLHQYPIGTPLHHLSILALEAAIANQSNPAESFYAMGMVHVDLGDYDSAMMAFQRAIAINPLARKVALQMAQIHQKNADYELALKDYLRSVDGRPTSDVLGAIGTVHLLQGNFELAFVHLEQALRAAPNSEVLQKNMIVAYHQQTIELRKLGQTDVALSMLSKGLETFPDSRVLLYDLGSTYQMIELYDQAYQIYSKILRFDPNHVESRIGMATTLNNLGAESARDREWQKAIGYYRKALDYDANCWQAQHNLAEALFVTGWQHKTQDEIAAAAQAIDQVLAINPTQVKAQIYRQQIKQSTDEFKGIESAMVPNGKLSSSNQVKRRQLGERLARPHNENFGADIDQRSLNPQSYIHMQQFSLFVLGWFWLLASGLFIAWLIMHTMQADKTEEVRRMREIREQAVMENLKLRSKKT